MKLKLLASAVFGVALSLSGVAEANSNFSTNLYLGHSTGFTDTVGMAFNGCPAGSTYYGPADCIPTAVVAGYGVRPISKLAASNGLSLTVNCTSLDAVCADTFATATGGITTNNVTLAAAMAISGSTTVKTLYCQNTNGTHCSHDETEATISKRATYVATCTVQGKPCLSSTVASVVAYTSVDTITFPRPFSLITFLSSQTNAGKQVAFSVNSPGYIDYATAGNWCNTDSICKTGITDNVFHSFIATVKTANSMFYVDNVATSGGAVGSTVTSRNINVLIFTGTSNPTGGLSTEFLVLANDLTAAQASAIYTNEINFY